jgi:hypothetical protein
MNNKTNQKKRVHLYASSNLDGYKISYLILATMALKYFSEIVELRVSASLSRNYSISWNN